MENLNLTSIHYEYTKDCPVLQDVNISAEHGQIICIIGQSGCGKSTILKLIAGLEKPSKGEIHICGKCVSGDVTYESPEMRGIGIVFQEPSLFPHKNVMENITIGIKQNIRKTEKKERAMDILQKLQIAEYAAHYPHTLSVGQQQKVAIARALLQDAKIMLLDEPFASLDGLSKQQIILQILPVLKSRNIATVLITHDPTEALTISDKIYVLQNHNIVQSGSATDLYYKPRTVFVANFFGKLNCVEATIYGNQAAIDLGEGKINIDLMHDVKLASNKFAEGEKINLYIRPEAFYIDAQGEITGLTVERISFLGMTSAIYLKSADNNTYEIKIRSENLPKIGDKITLALDKSKIFIFDKNDS